VFVRDFSKLQMSEEKKNLVKKFYYAFSTVSDNFYNDWIKVQSPETEKPDFAGFDNVFILSWPNWYGNKPYWCRNTVYSEMKRFARVCVSYYNDEGHNNNYFETKILVHNGLKIMKNGKPQMPIGQFKTDKDNDLNKRTADKKRKICDDLEEAGVFKAKNSVTGAAMYHRPRTHFHASETHVFVKAGETIPDSLTKMLKLLSTKIVFEGNLVHEEQNGDSIVFDELDYTRRSNPTTKQAKKARKDAEKYELLLDGVERMMTLSEIEQECANKYVNLAGEYYLPSNEQRIISVLSGKRIMRTKVKTKALLTKLEKIGIQSVVLSGKAFNLEPNILDDIIGVDTSDFKDTNWTQRGLTEWHHIQGSETGYKTFRFWEESGQEILVKQRKDFVVSCFVCDYKFFNENQKYFKVEPGLDEYGLKLLRRTLPVEMPEQFVKALPSLFDIEACKKDGVTIPEEIASLF
jgi:hypothetical protein